MPEARYELKIFDHVGVEVVPDDDPPLDDVPPDEEPPLDPPDEEVLPLLDPPDVDDELELDVEEVEDDEVDPGSSGCAAGSVPSVD